MLLGYILRICGARNCAELWRRWFGMLLDGRVHVQVQCSRHLPVQVPRRCAYLLPLEPTHRPQAYHSATSPAFGFSTRTTLSQFNKQRGSNANLSCDTHKISKGFEKQRKYPTLRGTPRSRSMEELKWRRWRGWDEREIFLLKTYLAHEIHSRLAQLVREVVALHKPDAMLAGDGAFHLDGALDHAMNEGLGLFALAVVVEEDRCEGVSLWVTEVLCPSGYTHEVLLDLVRPRPSRRRKRMLIAEMA